MAGKTKPKKKQPLDMRSKMYLVLALCSVMLLVCIGISLALIGWLPFSSAAPQSVSTVDSESMVTESGYNKEENTIDTQAYTSTILEQSADAGESYIDETLFLGDSNTARMYRMFDYCSYDNAIGSVGMSAKSLATFACVQLSTGSGYLTMPQAVAKLQPRRVILTFGTNDLNPSYKTADFIKNYQTGIEAVVTAYPSADIIVNAIPPIGQQHSNQSLTQTQVDEFNKALVEMCKEKGWKFLNSAEALKDSTTGYAKAGYVETSDGIHLTRTAMDALFSYIRTHSYITEDDRPALTTIPKHTGDKDAVVYTVPVVVPAETATPEPEATEAPASSEAEATATPEPEVTATPEPTVTPTPEPTAAPTPVDPPAGWPSDIEAKDLAGYGFAVPSTAATQYEYTGWQDIDGVTYYYDPATHQPVTGQQVIQGNIYTFGAAGALNRTARGIDVSKFQGSIDWHAVKNDGITFAIIRCGYRGYGSGALVEDSTYRRNIQGAINAGLKVGVYFYSQAVNEQEAVEEASMVLSLVSGYSLPLGVYYDTESVSGGRANALSAAERTACAVAFCETIRGAGYRAGVYSYASWFYNALNFANISKYNIWIAQYRDKLSFSYKYNIWQYTGSGRVNGISKPVDMNIG